MSANKKLQGEIDACLKKVAEGKEVFDEIWDKVHNASTPAQKEKFEGELKREIKKLQRLREQIKGWITGDSVKDKQPLMDARKAIESDMERFKYCERETKTKAYSKEGLAQAARADPMQQEKMEVRDWIDQCISDLESQVDAFESELETLKAKRKGGKKSDREEQLTNSVTRHKNHVKNMELAMRLMENDQITPSDLNSIKEDVQYYVESNQDPDFQEDETLYDVLNLDELAAKMEEMEMPTATTKGKKKSADDDDDDDSVSTPPSSTHTPVPAAAAAQQQSFSKPAATSSAPATAPAAATAAAADNNTNKSKKGVPTPTPVAAPAAKKPEESGPTAAQVAAAGRGGLQPGSSPQKGLMPAPGAAGRGAGAPAAAAVVAGGRGAGGNAASAAAAAAAAAAPNASAAAPGGRGAGAVKPVAAAPAPAAPAAAAPATQQQQAQQQQQQRLPPNAQKPIATTPQQQQQQAAPAPQQQQQQPQQQQQQQPPVQQQQQQAQQQQQQPPQQQQQPQQPQQVVLPAPPLQPQSPALAAQLPAAQQGQMGQQQQQQQQQVKGGAAADPRVLASRQQQLFVQQNAAAALLQQQIGLGAIAQATSASKFLSAMRTGLTMDEPDEDWGDERLAEIVLASFQHEQNALTFAAESMRMLDASFKSMPESDNDRRQPFDNPSVFERLDPDTLFFIFYYQPNTYQQYLAARELKKQGWRFHKKYLTWFQRHEEPLETTAEHEQGTYVYFDYETGWCQRIKSEFMFEYVFLEDELPVPPS